MLHNIELWQSQQTTSAKQFFFLWIIRFLFSFFLLFIFSEQFWFKEIQFCNYTTSVRKQHIQLKQIESEKRKNNCDHMVIKNRLLFYWEFYFVLCYWLKLSKLTNCNWNWIANCEHWLNRRKLIKRPLASASLWRQPLKTILRMSMCDHDASINCA